MQAKQNKIKRGAFLRAAFNNLLFVLPRTESHDFDVLVGQIDARVRLKFGNKLRDNELKDLRRRANDIVYHCSCILQHHGVKPSIIGTDSYTKQKRTICEAFSNKQLDRNFTSAMLKALAKLAAPKQARQAKARAAKLDNPKVDSNGKARYASNVADYHYELASKGSAFDAATRADNKAYKNKW